MAVLSYSSLEIVDPMGLFWVRDRSLMGSTSVPDWSLMGSTSIPDWSLIDIIDTCFPEPTVGSTITESLSSLDVADPMGPC